MTVTHHYKRWVVSRDGNVPTAFQGSCSCGFVGQVRPSPADAREDWVLRRDDELAALEAEVVHDRDWDLLREETR